MSVTGFANAEVFGGIGVFSATEITGNYFAFLDLPTIDRSNVEASSSQVVTDLLLPPGAVVTQVVVRITADAPGTTTVGGIATVRAAAGDPDATSDELVIDFGTLRTVSALAATVQITKVTPWAGTKFTGTIELVSSLDGQDVTFTELQTERLLVEVGTSQSPATLAKDGLVITTTPPADLELLVGATRVFFRAGPAPAGFSTDVDITAAVQAVVDAGGVPDEDGNLSVRVTLSARVPGDLGLTLPEPPRFLRTVGVDFPGPTTPVTFREEGVADLVLPLPAEAAGWTIHRVIATVVADDPGPLRVLPNVDPLISTDAELILNSDRRLVARLPDGPVGRFAELAGVRILLTPDAGGIEVGGALHAGTATEPGEAFVDATLTPVSLAAGPAAWATLVLPRTVRVATLLPDQDSAVWVSLAVTRGSANLALADPAASPGDVAVLRRVAPNGLTKVPSTATKQRATPGDPPQPIPTDVLALRVVGVAPEDAPVPVVLATLADGPATVSFSGAGSMVISADPPGRRSPLVLRLTTTAATRVVVGPVVVAYTEPVLTKDGPDGPLERRSPRQIGDDGIGRVS